jgi:hypothetical protein
MADQEEDQAGAIGGCEDKGTHWNVQGASYKRRGEIEGALGAVCGELDTWKQT